MSWAAEEFATVDLGDKRCDWREILEAHSQCTTQGSVAISATGKVS